MRSEAEIEELLDTKRSRTRYGTYAQDDIEIEMLEWVLGRRDEQPDSRFAIEERA